MSASTDLLPKSAPQTRAADSPRSTRRAVTRGNAPKPDGGMWELHTPSRKSGVTKPQVTAGTRRTAVGQGGKRADDDTALHPKPLPVFG